MPKDRYKTEEYAESSHCGFEIAELWIANSTNARPLSLKSNIRSIRNPKSAIRMRRILHIDMDAFYASVEQRDDAALRGRPVAVGGRPASRGVVAAASYEARAFGVRSAMPMATAVRLCPHAGHRAARLREVRGVSSQVFAIYREVTPLVEPLSLDEAYLDVTENALGRAAGDARSARGSKGRIRDETRLTASAGVAPEQVPRQDRVGLEEARRADRDRARARRALPAGAADRRLLGRRAGDGRRALRERGIDKLVDVRTIAADELRRSSAAWRRGCSSWHKASTTGRSSPTGKPSRRAARTRSTAISPIWTRSDPLSTRWPATSRRGWCANSGVRVR